MKRNSPKSLSFRSVRMIGTKIQHFSIEVKYYNKRLRFHTNYLNFKPPYSGCADRMVFSSLGQNLSFRGRQFRTTILAQFPISLRWRIMLKQRGLWLDEIPKHFVLQEGFHSHNQQQSKFIVTEDSFYIRKYLKTFQLRMSPLSSFFSSLCQCPLRL